MTFDEWSVNYRNDSITVVLWVHRSVMIIVVFFFTVDDNSGCLTRLVVRALSLIYSEDLRFVVSKQLDKPEKILLKYGCIYI